ncbi:hypothetical protein KQX54_013193 [Cotesia glomerata]|uniref:Uncharacterized protein n=1 Tax=Cotesia glomerata TaxID=32391 RepID=A0AAV7J322_COTGL|nr:hypothetical protein KQX54_013193 [Cotesia glomerata]
MREQRIEIAIPNSHRHHHTLNDYVLTARSHLQIFPSVYALSRIVMNLTDLCLTSNDTQWGIRSSNVTNEAANIPVRGFSSARRRIRVLIFQRKNSVLNVRQNAYRDYQESSLDPFYAFRIRMYKIFMCRSIHDTRYSLHLCSLVRMDDD